VALDSTLIGSIQSEVDGAVARMRQANDKAGKLREAVGRFRV